MGGSGPTGEFLMETPPWMATAAGGTHATGMHSCFLFFLQKKLNSMSESLDRPTRLKSSLWEKLTWMPFH